MLKSVERFLQQHHYLTRRWFLSSNAAAAAVLYGVSTSAMNHLLRQPELTEAISKLESWLTHPDDFRDVSRGKPLPHSLPEAKKSAVGLTRDSWRLEVISDPDKPAKLGREFTKKDGTALKFDDLLKLAEKNSVRFPKVMTCLNIGCPLGMGIWEGVPLRDVLWMTEPREDLRRVFYYGYHNDDPQQMFRSSLPVGRVLEDPYDLPPVILCYKLNGQWLSSERGGPVRIVVPEHYGFKSIKWLTTIVLSNLDHANDTYAEKNNDVDSPLKSFAAVLSAPREVSAQAPFAVTGYAQVGLSGVRKVQVAIHNEKDELPANDKYFAALSWQDAELLAPPDKWGGGLPEDKIPAKTSLFTDDGSPTTWPIRLGKVHWAIWVAGLPPGEYTLRSRTVDEKGIAQPLPRPFRKSGHAAIETISFVVK